jgi:hypothetical protein
VSCGNANFSAKTVFEHSQFGFVSSCARLTRATSCSLRDKRLQTQHFAADRDEQVAKASKLLGPVSDARLRRAEVASCQSQVEDVISSLACLRKDNDNSCVVFSIINFLLFMMVVERERLRILRDNLANRRRTLSTAVQLPPPSLNHSRSQESITLSNALARARSGLVQELVEVFNVVEVGGRPPIGGKAGTKGEWTIGDLVLPVPGDIRRKPHFDTCFCSITNPPRCTN